MQMSDSAFKSMGVDTNCGNSYFEGAGIVVAGAGARRCKGTGSGSGVRAMQERAQLGLPPERLCSFPEEGEATAGWVPLLCEQWDVSVIGGRGR